MFRALTTLLVLLHHDAKVASEAADTSCSAESASPEGEMAQDCGCSALSRDAALRCLDPTAIASSSSTSCSHRETSARHVVALGLDCATSSSMPFEQRGFFVLSRDATQTPVCSGGDAFHVRVIEQTLSWRFAVLSEPVGPEAPAAYWTNTSAARSSARTST